VKYRSVDCQKNHRKQHKKACKKRAAEIQDDRLFTQHKECSLGECSLSLSLCYLPLPLDENIRRINSFRSKRICVGCVHANQKQEMEQGLEQKCPYCREPVPKTDEEVNHNNMENVKVNMENVKVNDPVVPEFGHGYKTQPADLM